MDPRVAANRDNWNDRVAVHVRSRFYDVDGWLREAPGPRPWELDALGDVGGLSVVHLQCHFGLDALQLARAGATVTGLDFSPAAVDAARDLAERCGLSDRATFVCADVFRAAEALHGQVYDVVYVSLGALTWLPSVARWAEQAAALVRPGGRLYLHDGHPLAWALDPEEPRLAVTFFEEAEPYVDDSGETYTDAETEAPIAHTRTYEWNHGLGEIVTALIDHGLRLDRLVEHDWTLFPAFPWLVAGEQPGTWTSGAGMPRVPLSFTVLASRPG
jgi:SAM-dependent methyltransferase